VIQQLIVKKEGRSLYMLPLFNLRREKRRGELFFVSACDKEGEEGKLAITVATS